jgi:hypothetical protein
VAAKPYSISSLDFAQPQIKVTDFPEFIAMQLAAVFHFRIDAKAGVYPKHEELVNYFKKQRLSDGRQVSPNQAKYLATFCRPVAAMMGGNKKGPTVRPLNP